MTDLEGSGPRTAIAEVPSGRSTRAVRMLSGKSAGGVSIGRINAAGGGRAGVSGRLILGRGAAGSTRSRTSIHHLSNRSPECRPRPRYDAAADEAATVKPRKIST